jgi:hypothetical protein
MEENLPKGSSEKYILLDRFSGYPGGMEPADKERSTWSQYQ